MAPRRALEQARAQVTIARADLFPTIDLSAGAARGRTSANRPLASYAVPNQATVQNDFVIGPAVSYEIDLFGRVRREVEGAKATEQQAEADFENTRLVLLAQLVTDYFALRESDAEIAVVAHSLGLQRDALGFIISRHDLGFATGLDLAQQQALVDASATQFELLQNQRAEFEHAIATLVGAPAPGFGVPAAPAAAGLPAVPIGVPSDLLQRRPDVASAERSMACGRRRNARIGVARAAYFPTIGLGAGFSEPERRLAAAMRCPRCSRRRRAGSGRWGCRRRRRSSMPGVFAARCALPMPTIRPRSRATARPC